MCRCIRTHGTHARRARAHVHTRVVKICERMYTLIIMSIAVMRLKILINLFVGDGGGAGGGGDWALDRLCALVHGVQT